MGVTLLRVYSMVGSIHVDGDHWVYSFRKQNNNIPNQWSLLPLPNVSPWKIDKCFI